MIDEESGLLERSFALAPFREVVGDVWVREETIVRETKNVRRGTYIEERQWLLECGHSARMNNGGATRPRRTSCHKCGLELAKKEAGMKTVFYCGICKTQHYLEDDKKECETCGALISNMLISKNMDGSTSVRALWKPTGKTDDWVKNNKLAGE